MSKTIMEMIGIDKTFPGVKALNDINIRFNEGIIHCLVGENGAGKSTMMNVLSGVYPADKGTILWGSKEVKITDELFAQKLGIAMVHQENSLIPNMTVQENIFLGRYESNRFGLVNNNKMKTEASKLLSSLDMDNISPTGMVIHLSVAEKQLVEIAKALSYHPKLIILDEPTAALTPKEVKVLFKIISKLREKKVAVIYISHRLDEIFEIADEISILRDGNLIKTCDAKDISKKELISLMVGRELRETRYEHHWESKARDAILEVKDMNKEKLFTNINFELREGEILGFAGLVGAGRTEVMESLYGHRKYDSGEIFLKGKMVNIKSPYQAIKLGIGMIPEERKVKSLFLGHSVKNNINISVLRRLKNRIFLSKKKEIANAQAYVKKLNIKTPDIIREIKNLSGGNQQKTIIARWLAVNAKVLILDEPTHGIDVGAKAEIYQIINDMAKSGVGIILISSELPELLALCNRIAVMRKGTISAVIDRSEFSQEKIMKFASL